MMWKRTAAALLSGAMTLGLLTGCGGAPSASSGSGAASAPAAAEGMDKSDTLIYGAEFMDDTLNPMLDSQDCGPMLYRGLMRTDEDCNPSATWPRTIRSATTCWSTPSLSGTA